MGVPARRRRLLLADSSLKRLAEVGQKLPFDVWVWPSKKLRNCMSFPYSLCKLSAVNAVSRASTVE